MDVQFVNLTISLIFWISCCLLAFFIPSKRYIAFFALVPVLANCLFWGLQWFQVPADDSLGARGWIPLFFIHGAVAAAIFSLIAWWVGHCFASKQNRGFATVVFIGVSAILILSWIERFYGN